MIVPSTPVTPIVKMFNICQDVRIAKMFNICVRVCQLFCWGSQETEMNKTKRVSLLLMGIQVCKNLAAPRKWKSSLSHPKFEIVFVVSCEFVLGRTRRTNLKRKMNTYRYIYMHINNYEYKYNYMYVHICIYLNKLCNHMIISKVLGIMIIPSSLPSSTRAFRIKYLFVDCFLFLGIRVCKNLDPTKSIFSICSRCLKFF